MDWIAQSLADGAMLQTAYKDLYISLIYKLALNTVKPWFGEQPHELLEVDHIREPNWVAPVILGNQAIDGDPQTITEYGFSLKTLPRIAITQAATQEKVLLDKELTLRHGSRNYRTHVKVTEGGASFPPKIEDKPDYGAFWRDGQLTGLVITGTNFRGEAVATLDEYLSYYQEKGFVFSEKSQSIDNVPDFLKMRVAGGQLDYFIKEAHTGGDSKNLFRTDLRGSVLKGIRKDGKGKIQEEIELIYPEVSPSTPEPVSYTHLTLPTIYSV